MAKPPPRWHSLARLVDDAVIDDETKHYAKARVVTADLGVLVALAGMVAMRPTTAFNQLLAELNQPSLPDDRRWR